MTDSENRRNKIRGSMIGGAVGDALGYPVEFMSMRSINSTFGADGITEYELDKESGKAVISDDTQMTLFTANGILVNDANMRSAGGRPREYVARAYQDWFMTQMVPFGNGGADGIGRVSWLMDVPELYARRAPGNTCISALNRRRGAALRGVIENEAINDSKGCGGIMRIAPLGLHYGETDIGMLDEEAAAISAITHGNSLGCMPPAVMTHILNRIVYPVDKPLPLKQITAEAEDRVCRIFAGDRHLDELRRIIDKAVILSDNNRSDLENIESLGEGWVSEETLAIALYCALRYEHDFSAGIIAAVNHDGDTDSTGAVTGNILGAINGFNAIEDKWKRDLELYDVILEMSDDLCYDIKTASADHDADENWKRKYVELRWK